MHPMSHRRSAILASAAAVALFGLSASHAFADPHTTGVPVLNSDPGAPFTMYLDFAGFNYTGAWSGSEMQQPGSTPALNLNGEATNIATFTAADQANIDTIWSRVAQSYSLYNINVTTVDPAVKAGQAATDLARQNYYDATPDMTHMVIGSQIRGTGATATNWYSFGADGVSGLGVLSKVAGDNGGTAGGDSPPDVSHTNWMFTESLDAVGSTTGELLTGSASDYIGAIASHENGHAVGLYHQSDYAGTKLVNEYGQGDTKQGAGSYVATMGQSLSTTPGNGPQRTTWRSGPSDNGTTNLENDVAVTLASNASVVTSTGITTATLALINDGIGHSAATATPLPLSGSTVNYNAAKGIIVPASSTNPQPTLVSDYTQDYFSFVSNGITPITLTAIDGTENLVPGTADGVGTLQSTLDILNSLGGTVGIATEATDTLSETFTGLLPAGTYEADIASIGGHVEDDSANPTFNTSTYYNEGSFFLTGSGFVTAVPEPASIAVLLVGGVALLGRRRRSTNA